MNTFFRFFYEFISIFFDGLRKLFEGIIGGILKIFDIGEYKKILDQDKDASDNFWELADRIKKDKKSPGVIIEYHKQNVYIDVIRLFKDGVITDDDLAEFSDDFKDTVNELKKRFM